MSIKKVLIAHQSTIPHYRVPFYEAVERLRPKWWEFSVIYDTAEARGKSFLEFDHRSVNFEIKPNRTYTLKLAGKQLSFQPFPFEGAKYDLLVDGKPVKQHRLSDFLFLAFRRQIGRLLGARKGLRRSTNLEGLKALAEADQNMAQPPCRRILRLYQPSA